MRTSFSWLSAHVIVGALTPALWLAAADGYTGDSFWTLSTFGRLGVVAISVLGMAALGACIAWKTRRLRRTLPQVPTAILWVCDVLIGVLLFALIFSVSPQIFYSFYQLIFDGLPQQWVIDGPLNWDRLAEVIPPRTAGSLADHLAFVAMGGVVLFTTYLHWR